MMYGYINLQNYTLIFNYFPSGGNMCENKENRKEKRTYGDKASVNEGEP